TGMHLGGNFGNGVKVIAAHGAPGDIAKLDHEREPWKWNDPHQWRGSKCFRCDRSLLVVATLEGCAEDVAQRCARIGRTEIGHCFAFFGDFERLDRELDAAGLAVVLSDACVDLFALAETLWTLIVTIAGEVSTTDEGSHFRVSDTDFNAPIVDFDDFGGDDSVLLQASAIRSAGVGEVVSSKLLNTERDTFLFDVNVEDLGRNH